jgi:bacterial/archaeal transporter family protein
MSQESPDNPRLRATTLLGMPAWLTYSLFTVLLWGGWGAVSKVASATLDANTNQIFFTLGLLPLVPFVLRAAKVGSSGRRLSGGGWAFLTGILGGVGNVAFFRALATGGKASIVVPATALFPVVTVVLAVTLLRERINALQWIGLGLSFVAIYLLSS